MRPKGGAIHLCGWSFWWAGSAKAAARAVLFLSLSLAIAAAAIPLASQLWSVAWPVLSIAIDAGHGGIDPGAIGPQGLKEKMVTLDVARRVQSLLRAAGEQAFLTPRMMPDWTPLKLGTFGRACDWPMTARSISWSAFTATVSVHPRPKVRAHTTSLARRMVNDWPNVSKTICARCGLWSKGANAGKPPHHSREQDDSCDRGIGLHQQS